jgi:phosphatidylglycerophosphatase A
MTLKQRLAFVFATGFGSGYSPLAPGTAGTVVGLLFVWGMSFMDLLGQVVFTLIVSALAMIAADIVATTTGLKDPGLVVADEIAGMMVTMIGVPLTTRSLLLGFILFRVMDVVKPPPARQFEQLKGGVGIVADDLMAGVYAQLVLRGLLMLV